MLRVEPRTYDRELAHSYYRLWLDGGEIDEEFLWDAVICLKPKASAIYRSRVRSSALLRDLDDLIQIFCLEMVRTLKRNHPDLIDTSAWDAWTHRATIHIFQHWMAALPKHLSIDEQGLAVTEMLSGSLSPAHRHALLEEIDEACKIPDLIEQTMLDHCRFGHWVDLIRQIHRAQNRGGNTRTLLTSFKVPRAQWEFVLDYTKVLRRLAMREIYDSSTA